MLYNNLISVSKIEDIYYNVRLKTRHREKIVNFELFYMTNIMNIYNILLYKKYNHSDYNIFLIREPKYRIVMSENISDKIINHLISFYVLLPLLSPHLLDINVATRKNKGLKAADFYTKKYLNKLKNKYNNFFVLKCDIKKYFYNIDHNILISKLKKYIYDEDVMNILENIISTTNNPKVNERIDKLVEEEIKKLKKRNNKENIDKIKELEAIPHYIYNKGVSIGNMTSQIFAIYYLSDLDHFIKEKLRIKYYIRYMDDFILLHEDKKYLSYCLEEIKNFLDKEKLSLNNKTQIFSIKNGLNFLGYRYILKNKRLIKLMNKKTKNRIVRRLKYIENHQINKDITSVKASYKGYFMNCQCGSFLRRNNWLKEL